MEKHLLSETTLLNHPLADDPKRMLLTIALRIKQLRTNAGVTQETFYIDTNIHIARIETGKQNISIFTLFKICDYFGISIEHFFAGLKD